MALTFLKHKWQRVTAIILLVFIVLVLIPALIINRYWSPVLADKVKAAVLEGTDSLYHVSFREARLHILQGKIVIYDIDLKPDTTVYNQKIKKGLAPNNLYELKVKKLVVANIHPFNLYFHRKLNISKIILSAPQLEVSYHLNHTKDTVDKDKRTPWQKLSKTLKLVHVGEILLNDVNFKYKDYTGQRVAISELKEMNLKATDLLIDSVSQTDRTRLLYCKDIITELYNYTGKTPNGLYTYKFKSAKLSTNTSRLNISGLDLQPVQPDIFFRKSGGDRLTLHINDIQLNRFDYLNYHRYHTFKAANLILNKGTFSVYSNPNSGPKKTDRIVTFPHVAIHQIKATFNLDTLTVKQLNITYDQFNKKAGRSGAISFNNTSGRLLNITNNPDTLKKNNITSARLTTYFMNRGRLDISFAFNITDLANTYSYRGKLGEMDLRLLNQAVVPLALIKVTSGKLNSLDFNINSTKNLSTGTVKLLYSNLKVNILRRDSTKEKGYAKKGLATFFANNAVLSRNNPDNPGEVPRSAFVNYERPFNSPFFKTIWQTLLSGIKPCAGLGKAEEARVKVQMTEHEKRKAERALKKAARKKKRAEKQKKKEKEKAVKEKQKS